MLASGYRFIRPLLFRLDPERAHEWSLAGLKAADHFGQAGLFSAGMVNDPVTIMGIEFPNRVGLGAGLDKKATCARAFGDLGFGHVEVGTLTPRPQAGNPQPRLFRLPPVQAIINRMGFNNPGIESGVASLEANPPSCVLGVNLGKNFDTPNDSAPDDYLKGLRASAAIADYIAINLSSPNTKGLRDLQHGEAFGGLIKQLADERNRIASETGKRVPLAIKLAPDLTNDQICAQAEIAANLGADAIIATNTTLARDAVEGMEHGTEAGGLSGAPLTDRANTAMTALRTTMGTDFPLIGVGGIMTALDAAERIAAGANLVQLYTGFVYGGPPLISEVAQACKQVSQN